MTDLVFSPAEDVLIDIAGTFAHDFIAPDAQIWERNRTMPRSVIQAAGELGLCRLLVPKDQGGHGIGFTAMAKIMEELSYAD